MSASDPRDEEIKQLKKALRWALRVGAALSPSQWADGQMRFSDGGCGCCADYFGAPDDLIETIKATLIETLDDWLPANDLTVAT